VRVLNYQESKQWCEKAPLSMKVGPHGHLSYGPSVALGVSVKVPVEAGPTIALASSLLAFEANVDFYGGLLWLVNWDIGTPQIERSGLRMIEQMRRGYGICSSIDNTPGNLFRTDEIADLHAFISVLMLFAWDAYFIPRGTRYFMYFRSNGYIYLVTDEEDIRSRLLKHLAYWKPSGEISLYVNIGDDEVSAV
jgi:hypothetical protein